MSKLSEQIIELKTQGKSYNEIKSILNCSLGTIAYHCGAGQKEKTNIRQRNRTNKKKQYIRFIKQTTACADCKENYPYWIMQFDHLKDKKLTIGSRLELDRVSLEDLKQEVLKCDVVCANCHSNRTHFRMIKDGSDTLDISELYGE